MNANFLESCDPANIKVGSHQPRSYCSQFLHITLFVTALLMVIFGSLSLCHHPQFVGLTTLGSACTVAVGAFVLLTLFLRNYTVGQPTPEGNTNRPPPVNPEWQADKAF